MRVMKFGGTSVGSAERMRGVAALIESAVQETRVVVVASAVSGATDLLVAGARAAADGAPLLPIAVRFRSRHREIRDLLAGELGAGCSQLDETLDLLGLELENLLRGVGLLRECSPAVLAHLSGLGERASCAILSALLRARGLSVVDLDPIRMLPCTGDPLEASPQPHDIRQRFMDFRDGSAPLALMPGFFGGDARGKTMSLGRGGSDWSAALAAAAVDADLLEIWTDVDGIYTADPRVVDDAFALAEVSFDEAMELAHFGAKVLHPKMIAPARERGIPVRVCNTLRPHEPGTMVLAHAAPSPFAVRGISFLSHLALLNVAGPGMKGVPGVAARIFTTMAARDVSVVLITQASSECTITFCVREDDANAAVVALEQAFDAEIASGRVDQIEVQRGLAILSIVGDGMRTRVGVAGTFFAALGAVACNIVAIAQGSSERSISAVVAARDGDRALRSVHRCFFQTREVIELYLMGVGTVGHQLLRQLQQRPVHAGNVELKLCGISDSRQMLLDPAGIAPAQAVERLLASPQASDFGLMMASIRERLPDQPVLVDCTSSTALADAYPRFLAAGFHIVTASKKANSAAYAHYLAIRQAAARHRRRFHYETNVGAGLPVIDTLRNLLAGGDKVLRIEGVLSGSLSFLFGQLEAGVAFSAAVRDARDRGYTEPDPRDDLSGLDVARKVLILARETGSAMELEDVQVTGVLPAAFDATGDVEAFLERLPQLDAHFAGEIERLQARGEVLRFVGTFAGNGDGCSVGVRAVGPDHPLFGIRGGENAFSFLTAHYQPRPLVVRGYGAGAAVTAAGVLADVLKLASGRLP